MPVSLGGVGQLGLEKNGRPTRTASRDSESERERSEALARAERSRTSYAHTRGSPTLRLFFPLPQRLATIATGSLRATSNRNSDLLTSVPATLHDSLRVIVARTSS